VCPEELSREARRILPHLPGGRLKRDGELYRGAGSARLARIAVRPQIVAALTAQGLLRPSRRWAHAVEITAAGRAHAARAVAGAHGFLAQHGELVRAKTGPARFAEAGTLLHLLTRKSSPFGEAESRAALQLAADFERAAQTPRVTADWSLPVARETRGAPRTEDVTAAALMARKRCAAALDAAGPGMAGLLFDLCALGRSLAETEAETLSPRPALLGIVKHALARLAVHYGFAPGPRHVRLEAWRAEGPAFADQTDAG
jgi:hypothetical protein